MTASQRELVYAGLDLVAEQVLQARLTPGSSGQRLELGAQHTGTDGKAYEVAAWRDVDDHSAVFYFQRGPGSCRS